MSREKERAVLRCRDQPANAAGDPLDSERNMEVFDDSSLVQTLHTLRAVRWVELSVHGAAQSLLAAMLLSIASLSACSGQIAPEIAGDATGARPDGEREPTGNDDGNDDGKTWFDSPDGEMESCDAAGAPLPLVRRSEAEVRYALLDVLGDRFDDVPLTDDALVVGYRAHDEALTTLEAARYAEFAAAVAGRTDLGCTDAACLDAALSRIKQLYGRPLLENETQRFSQAFSALQGELGMGHAQAARKLLEAALQSPNFLYISDPSQEASEVEGSLALARRLARLVWRSIPDQTLADAALSGQLRDAGNVEQQVRRMLADPKAERMWLDFHSQWLWLDDRRDTLDLSQPRFEGLDGTVLEAMEREFENFVLDVAKRPDGKLNELFAGRQSRPGPALEPIYGEALDGSPRTMRAERAGILGLPWVLAHHAHREESSTVWRGQMLRVKVLCGDIPAPPANAALLAPDVEGLSKPEAFAKLLEVEGGGCAGCHMMMDPLGFALEHFDAAGRYREIDERGFDVDATGTAHAIAEEDALAQGFVGAAELADALAQSEVATRCYVEQWLRYAWAQSPAGANRCGAQDIYERFVESGETLEALVVATATSTVTTHAEQGREPALCQ